MLLWRRNQRFPPIDLSRNAAQKLFDEMPDTRKCQMLLNVPTSAKAAMFYLSTSELLILINFLANKIKMAGEILVSGVSEILKKVLSMATKETGAAWNVNGELKNLKNTSSMIQALLVDAEKRQVEEESVKLWLKRLKQVYHDANDVLDDFAYERLRHQMEMKNRFKAKVRNFFTRTNPFVFCFTMAHKIKAINTTLVEIEKDAVAFKLNQVRDSVPHLYTDDRKTTSHDVIVSKFVGRETERKTLVNLLIDPQNQVDEISVLSVVGIGGLGKTALVQVVYNDKSVEEFFDLRIWVCVSEVFDVERIFKDALESITKTRCDFSSMEAIVLTFQGKISGKRFLFVLDDVWNEEFAKWERFYSRLSEGARKGSKLIVTTRSSKVASIVGPPRTHFELKELSEEECWLLFKLWAFREGGAEETSNLVKIGKDIVSKCGGVPLAVMHLGGVMQCKKEEREWVRIRNSQIWDLPENKKIMGVLKLSYDSLLPPIKQCFSYCALFPKDASINKNKLIQMWMGEGFLEPSQESQSMEDIGDEYFLVLMYNSFFQDIERDEFDQISDFKMHDLVHDLARLVSKSDFSFENFGKTEDVGQIFRISSAPEILKSLSTSNKLRTYMLLSTLPRYSVKLEFGSLFSKFKYLRVLDLHRAYVTELPSFIGKLRHLRLLDLSETFLTTLPDSVCSLYYLQTLSLSLCEKLRELPKDMKKLIGLRHLAINGCTKLDRMPRNIGHLSSLQSLSKFIVGEEDSGCNIRELKDLNLGGEIEIQHLEMVTTAIEAKEANLDQKSNLQALKLCWSETSTALTDDVLEALRPHSSLKKLEVHWFVAISFPTWMNVDFLPSLVEVRLLKCSCLHLPPLGHLQFLKVLAIGGMEKLTCIGKEFYGDNRTQEVGKDLFPSLRKLTLEHLPNLEEWMEPSKSSRNNCFPFLDRLDVRRCNVLTKTPSQFPCLKELVVASGSESLVKSLLSNASTLIDLSLAYIDDMNSLPQGLLQRNNLLRELTICECPQIRSLPLEELRFVKSLERLDLFNCKSLTIEPELFSCLTFVRHLTIAGVKEMDSSLSEWLCHLPLLDNLGIGEFVDKPDVFPMIDDLEHIVSLRTLSLYGWPEFTTLPEKIQHLTKLRELEIMDFKGLVALPNWLTNLSSLKRLAVARCENLRYLPQNLSSSISKLEIYQCPLLKERCTTVTGEEWHKIVHIPFVEID